MKRYSLDELQTRMDFEKVAFGKNYIINGGFNYWNYDTIQTKNGYGSDDRWININTGSTKTHSRVASTDTERAFFNSPYFSRTVVASVAGASNNVGKTHKIENVTKLAGKTITISFWAKADSAKNIAIELQQVFGTGGTPSEAVISISSQLIALTSTWQKKTITVTLPPIVGKTLGTDGVHTSSTNIVFWFDAGSDHNARTANLGQQSGTFDIAEVKLEEGSVATPWTPYEGEFGGEIQACQRYYQIVAWSDRKTATAAGQYLHQSIRLPITMRVTPTIANISTGTMVNTYTNMGAFALSNIHYRGEGNSAAAGDAYILNRVDALSAEL